MALKFTAQPLSHLEQKIYLLLESEGKNVFTVKELKKLSFFTGLEMERLSGECTLQPILMFQGS
jgi:hypothetical protein